jgi:hypothetical protein
MNAKNELFFPPQLIGGLRDLRDAEWRRLVERVASLPDTDPDSLGFALMIIKLSGCLSCGPGSFRHMKGCLPCSRQAVGAYKGTDQSLVELFEESRREVVSFLNERKKTRIAA